MAEEISLREASRRLAKYIRAVEQGSAFVITRRGEPVARLVPVEGARRLTPEQEAARHRALERMRRGWDLGSETFDRDSLHER